MKNKFLLFLLPILFAAANVCGQTYSLVSTEQTDWSGTYLIVANDRALSGGTSSWGTYETVTVSGNNITTTSNISVTISKGGTNGTYYIYQNSNSTYLKEVTSNNFATSTIPNIDTEWVISIDTNGNALIGCASTSDRILRLNGNSGFRSYTSNTGTIPKLYKLSAPSCPAPTTQATNITATPGATTANLSWTNGNGDNRVVFMRQGTNGAPAPVNATAYTANATFGSGTQIGTSGWYAVYKGTGNNVNVTGLTAGASYRVMVVEYNDCSSSPQYNTATATNNPLNFSTITNPTITVTPASLSGFTYTLNNGPSSHQTLTLTGNNLTEEEYSELTVLLDDFEISETAGGSYGNNLLIELSPSSNTATIYVRLKAGLALGEYEDEIGIELSTDQSDLYVSLSGEVSCGVSMPNGDITLDPTPACGTATLIYEHGTNQPETGVTYYWQDTPTGTSTTYPVSSDYTVTTNGYYYVRGFNGLCWGDAMTSQVEVVITALSPTITTQPTDQSVTVGTSAAFNVTATGADSYQWQLNTGSGWSNITGETSSSYTTDNTTLAMDGYEYRVIVTNTCGDTSSSVAVLTVTEGPVAKTYTLVTDVSQLEAGKKYLIVSNTTQSKAMGNQGGNNRPARSVPIIGTNPDLSITVLPATTDSDTNAPFEFTLGGNAGEWTFYDPLEGGYLYASSSGSNHLHTQTTNDTNGEWTITIGSVSNPIAGIVSNGSNTNRFMQYNTSGSGLFSCYNSSSQQNVYLYKEGGVVSSDTHFRSQTNGDWTSTDTWESSSDGGVNWADATTYPGATAESVEIQAEHTVNVNSSAVTITNTQVYGTLEVTTPDAYSVSGEQNGVELFIKDGGVFLVNSPGEEFAVPVGNAFGLVETGGKIIAGPNMSSGTSFVDAYVGYWNGLFYFGDAAICEWANSTTTLGSSSPDDYDFFFPYEEDDMPIFRVTVTPGHVFGNNSYDNVFHSVLEIIEPATFSVRLGSTASPQKTKTFVGGVRGSGKLIMESNSGPVIIGNSEVVPELGGTATIVTNITDDRLRFPNGANVTAGSVFTIENSENTQNIAFERQGTFNIHGTLDITNMRITNTAPGGVFVKDGGTLRTRHTGGLFGGGSAIVNDTNFTMETGSIVEYYADVAQAISSGKEYYHLIFSGNGTKNPQNVTNVNTNGSILITGNPTVDYTTRNLGSPDGNSTDFTMDGGKLIIGTGGTQPRPGGIYNITGGAIEFTGNSITSIKVSPEYHDVIISGQNITPGGKGFTIKNILSVTSTGEINIPSTPDTETPYVVTAQKGVQVEEGGQLTFENNANLMQDDGAVNSGDILMEKNFKFSPERNQYNFVNSPVVDQNIRQIYEGTPRVQFYNEPTNYFIFNDDPDPGYTPGVGQALREPTSEGNPDSTPTAEFEGVPFNGTVILSGLTNGNTGFHLIGNPYPSQLDLNKLYADNEDLESRFLFWDNRGNTQITQYGDGYNGDHYARFNAAAPPGIGTGTPATGTLDEAEQRTPNGLVAVGSAVMARLKESVGTGTITLNNTQRTTGSSVNFFGKTNPSTEIDRYWLTMETPDGLNITNAIVYFEGGNDEYSFDDSKTSNASDNIYSVVGLNRLAIQGKSAFQISDTITLGYKAFKDGSHFIKLHKKEGVFADGINILLIDLTDEAVHNLSHDPYKFYTAVGQFNDRFIIVYEEEEIENPEDPDEPMANVEFDPSGLRVYKQADQTVILAENQDLKDLQIFNLQGQLMLNQKDINNKSYRFDNNRFGKQTLLLRVETQDGKAHNFKVLTH